MGLLGLVSVPTYVLVSSAIGLATYLHYKYKYSFFKKQGIPGPRPYPFLGTTYQMYTKGMIDLEKDLAKEYGKVAGLYEAGVPCLWTADEDIMKEVLVKQFNSFPNRQDPGSAGNDELMANMVMTLEDDAWRRVRTLLTPSFSTSKLRQMSSGINDCLAVFAEVLDKHAGNEEGVDITGLCSSLTMDIIARTSFGIRTDSQTDPNDPFIVNAKKIFDFQMTNPLILAAMFAPPLVPYMKKMGFSFFDKGVLQFFGNIVEELFEGRESGGKDRNDLLQLMVNAHCDDYDDDEVAREVQADGGTFVQDKGTRKGLSKKEVMSQCFMFFLAGFDTVASTVYLTLYYLALHPEYQQRAREEVDDVIGDKDTIDYDDVRSLAYVDQCIQETMRLHPAAPRTDRVVGQDVTVKGIHLRKGMGVVISILARHLDPEIWPEPEKFDPDRFSPEERARHGPYDHLPFGYGPRMCIAMRLGMMQTKMTLAHVLRKFTVAPCAKTQIPLKMLSLGMIKPEKGIWLQLSRR